MTTNNLDMSQTCKIDLRELTESIRQLEAGKAPVAEQSQCLVDIFGQEVRALRLKNANVSQIVVSLLQKLEISDDHNHLLSGAKSIADQVDNSPGDQPSYHNEYHVAEVVMAAFILAKRERLSNIQVAEVVVAAAAHDLWHPGTNNTVPFEIETHSFEIAAPILRESGWSELSIQHIKGMILATDFMNGVPKARENYLKTRNLPLDSDERVRATQCLLLTEADVLFSCFDSDYNEELSKLLSQEWNLPQSNLTFKQRVGFLKVCSFISDASKQLGLDARRLALIADLEKHLTA